MLSLEDTIRYHEEVAEEYQRVVDTGLVSSSVTIDMLYCHDTEVIEEHLENYRRCASEHRQLAEWLRELKAYREAVKEIKAYASIWMEWNEGMSKHEIAEKAMTDAKEGFIAIVEKHLKEVNADEDSD